MIAWFARNDVAANLLMVSVLLLGVYSLLNEVTVEVFPSTDPDIISVTVPLRGATPEDAELGLAVRIEEAIEGLEGVKRMTSLSREGSARVSLEVEEDYDPRQLLDEVKSRVDAINTFPGEAEKPVIGLRQRTFATINLAVYGSHPEAEIRLYAERVRDALLRIEGISQVSLDGVRRYEIAIEASQDRLREFDLSLDEIARAIRSSSVDLSAGNVRTLGGDVLIRSKGQAYRRSDFDSIVVKTNVDGSIVRVADVAVVKDGFQEDSVKTLFNGQPAAMIDVQRVGSESALDIAAKVKDYIASQQDQLPSGMMLAFWDDDAQQLKNRLSVLGSSALQGAVLVIGLLALFLRPKIAFWVFIGIPISFLGAFSIMGLLGISLNLMSAFGFIVVLGIVVDDAIVTGESIYQRLKLGDEGIEASVGGTLDVAVPVTFGVLTTMVAFFPIPLTEGHFGKMMGPMAAVVISVLFFSLVESKLVLPAHLKGLSGSRESQNSSRFALGQRAFADGFEDWIRRYYRPALEFFTIHRYATAAGFTGILFVLLMMISSGWIRFTLVPSIASESARATLTMPVGTQFAVTDRYVTRLFETALALQERYVDPQTGVSVIRHVLASTGSRRGMTGSHYGRVEIEMEPPESRGLNIDSAEIVAQWRELSGPAPGAESLTFRGDFFWIGNPIDIQLSGSTLPTLGEAAEQVKAHLAKYPTVYEIADSLSDGKEELRIELTPQGHVLGLTRNAVVSQVSQAFKGFQAQRIQRGRDDIRVLVRLPAAERADFATLNEMLIRTPAGVQAPLSHVAKLIPGKGPQEIKRIDRQRTVNITAEVDKANTNMTVLQAAIQTETEKILRRYPGISYTLEGEARERRESFSSLQSSLLVVLFAIYCMLALPLKSYAQPLLVMSVIPFGLIGAVTGHWLMDYDFSMLSVMGLLALSGVVVNDSLVLVHAVNTQRRQGRDLHEAVLNAGVIRFRPILLTSLTTFFGLTPLLLEKSTTAQFLIPMAISLGFGILFATAITLILAPVNMLIGRDVAELAKRSWRQLSGAEARAARSG